MSSRSHYATVRRAYDAALFYSHGPYTNWLAAACLDSLQLLPRHRLADVGGGSGGFASTLRQAVGGKRGCGSLTVVEPSGEMLDGALETPLVDAAVCSDAVGWASGGGGGSGEGGGDGEFERVLLKEVVHHLNSDDRRRLFGLLLRRRLSEGGQLCIVTRCA